MSITEIEANELYKKYVELQNNFEKTKLKKDLRELNSHKNLMANKFKYIIQTKTSQYKKFSNYEDLNQDGYEAFMMALNTFDPNKNASIFWWLHKYIDTRIVRKANAHSIVKVPIKKAKDAPPKKEKISFNAEDTSSNPEEKYIKKTDLIDLEKRLKKLNAEERKLISDVYGLDNDKIKFKDLCYKNNISAIKLNKKIKNILFKI